MAETSDSTSSSKDDLEQDTLSWSEKFRHTRKKIDTGFAMKVIKERTKTKEKHQWSVTFVQWMSGFQLFLGFSCIVIALLGLAAAFDTKERITREAYFGLRYIEDFHRKFIMNMTNVAEKERKDTTYFYMELVNNTTKIAEKDRNDMWEFHLRLLKNVTITARNEKKALIEQCQNQTKTRASDNPNEKQSTKSRSLKVVAIRPHKSIESYTTQSDYTTLSSPHARLEDLDKYGDPPASHLKYYDNWWDFPKFSKGRDRDSSDICDRQRYLCYGYRNTLDEDIKREKLIIDYLCVPAWTGIMYIITGLVGLRMMDSKKTVTYLQVSHSCIVLNFLGAILFAPGMLAVGIVQWHQEWAEFRRVVGQVTMGFAGVCVLVSLVLCFVGCCCPVSSHLQGNNYMYKRLSESTETLAEEKLHDEGIMESTETVAEEKPHDEVELIKSKADHFLLLSQI